jgi:hypothetical protein
MFDFKFECHLNAWFEREKLLVTINIARSNEILGWEGVGNRQLLCFFKA